MKTVLGYLCPHAGRVAAGAAIKFTAAVLELILPLLLAEIIDELVPAGDTAAIWRTRRLDVAAGSWGGGLQHYRQPDGRLGLHGDDPGTAPGSLPPDPGTLLHPGRPILTLLPGVPPHNDTYNVHQMFDKVQRGGTGPHAGVGRIDTDLSAGALSGAGAAGGEPSHLSSPLRW